METQSRGGCGALLVEDSPVLRKLLGEKLRLLGFTDVRAVASGRAALEALEGYRPELVCLDLMLPDVSGYEVCEFIRAHAHLRDVPVLVVSARNLPEDRAHAEEAGATGFLLKECIQQDFEQHVFEVLERAGTQRRQRQAEARQGVAG